MLSPKPIMIKSLGFNGFPRINESLLLKNQEFISRKQRWRYLVSNSIKCLTLDFGLGHALRVVRLSPASGSMLGVEPA